MSRRDRHGSIARSPFGPGSGSPGGLGRRNRQTSIMKVTALRAKERSDLTKVASIILREVCRVQDGRASNLVLEECNLYPRGEQ